MTSVGYKVTEAFFGKPRKLRIIIIGCGVSGIMFAYKLQKHLSDCEFIIYEKNEDVGGTWLENRDPGCACDIPSHAYQYSWAPNPDWKDFYSSSKELWQYFKRVAEDFNILPFVKLRHEVIAAEWREGDARWKVSVTKNDKSIITDQGDFVIDASGILKSVLQPCRCRQALSVLINEAATGNGQIFLGLKISRES